MHEHCFSYALLIQRQNASLPLSSSSRTPLPIEKIQVQILSLAPLTCLEKFLIAGSSPAHTAKDLLIFNHHKMNEPIVQEER